MRRTLLTLGGPPCPFGCRYCFTRFTQYESPLTLDAVEAEPALLGDAEVVYPACDVDLFARRDALAILARTARLGRSISVSTKARLRPSTVDAVAATARELAAQGRILKVSVSVSTKTRVREIEPHTPRYDLRMATLRALAAAGVPTALVLRPLLADVAQAEYEEILADAGGWVGAALVGDEYVDRDVAARRPLTASPQRAPALAEREVTWAAGAPTWPLRRQVVKADRLAATAHGLGIKVYESDLDLMAGLIRAAGAAGSYAAA